MDKMDDNATVPCYMPAMATFNLVAVNADEICRELGDGGSKKAMSRGR
jgi:hypothetical protein